MSLLKRILLAPVRAVEALAALAAAAVAALLWKRDGE